MFQKPAANPTGRYTSSLPIFNSSIFFLAIFEYRISMGCVVSYKLGAWNRISPDPTIHVIVNIHRNSRSSTIATYFQSSSTCKWWTEGEISWRVLVGRSHKSKVCWGGGRHALLGITYRKEKVADKGEYLRERKPLTKTTLTVNCIAYYPSSYYSSSSR